MAIKDRGSSIAGASEPPPYSSDYPIHTLTPLHSERLRLEHLSSECALSPSDLLPHSLVAHRRSLWTESTTDLPATKDFAYDIQRKGRKWAELKISADGLLSRNTPTFLEGSRIEGKVTLWAAQPEAINSVVVSVKGQVITGACASEHWTFFEVLQTVWSKSLGDPRKNHAHIDPETKLSPYSDKLRGTFSWPFSLEMPREIVVSSRILKAGSGTFRLPESYSERHGRASIRYEICTKFVRGLFRPDDRIRVAFSYVPLTIPGPPSLLRQLAYEQGAPLLGPGADPAGWHECRPIKLKGCVRGLHNAEVCCTLYLAKPLSYTRGAVLPCWLRLCSEDPEALNVLATPKAMVARLQRCVKATANRAKATEPSWKDQTELSELGIWWSAGGSTNIREMSGELHLDIDLKPSSAMAHFRIEYKFMLFPFDTIEFHSGVTTSLIEEPVEIVTGYAPGQRPIMYAPPEYECPDTMFCGTSDPFNVGICTHLTS